ncbi:hypothetical protein [Pedobacter sp. V48]|uniref:hypothetical protein n=1 Tax=Pedobacter sp. V48 TaxID=509635 RepID=UPI0003E5BF1F|nr:hypothetical protein [Pedobacter sp. V48]ETZ22407.1 hypothetical protein N824_01800 [Pedobacter sp. V48]
MFDQLIQVLQQHGKESVINNADVPNEYNEGVLQEANGSIMNVITDMVANGQGHQLAAAATDPNHQAAQLMQNGFVENIMQKFGINGAAAQSIAASLIPAVLSSLANGQGGASGSSTGGFSLDTITSVLGKTALDKDGDGKLGLGDITKLFGA